MMKYSGGYLMILPVSKIYRSVQLLLNIVVVIVDRFNSRRDENHPRQALFDTLPSV